MTAWAEKQLQVAREERRLRETMTKFNVTWKTGSAQKLTAKRKPKETNANVRSFVILLFFFKIHNTMEM